MGHREQPRYDASRNQWTLRHQNKRHYLCSGADNDRQAWEKAYAIMGRPALEVRIDLVGEAIDGWHHSGESTSSWRHDILAPFGRFMAADTLDHVHADYLSDFLAWLRRQTFTRGKKTDCRYSPSTLKRPFGFVEWYSHAVE